QAADTLPTEGDMNQWATGDQATGDQAAGHHRDGHQRSGRTGAGRAGTMRVIAAGLAVMAILAGCGSVPYRPAAAGGQTGTRTGMASAHTRTGVPPAGTRAGARALAQRLLSELVLPAGTRRLPARPVPSALSQPAQGLGMAASGTGVDLYRLFRLPMSMGAAQQFERAHPPAGLRFSETGWASQLGVHTEAMLAADGPPRAVPPGIDPA